MRTCRCIFTLYLWKAYYVGDTAWMILQWCVMCRHICPEHPTVVSLLSCPTVLYNSPLSIRSESTSFLDIFAAQAFLPNGLADQCKPKISLWIWMYFYFYFFLLFHEKKIFSILLFISEPCFACSAVFQLFIQCIMESSTSHRQLSAVCLLAVCSECVMAVKPLWFAPRFAPGRRGALGYPSCSTSHMELFIMELLIIRFTSTSTDSATI